MKPTQAQIEAAARAICEADGAFDPNESINDRPDWKLFENEAKAALAAAAEVGASPYAAEAKVAWQRAAERDNATIERCAQVAETAKLPVHHFDGAIAMCKTVDARIAIAAAIRALKEKP